MARRGPARRPGRRPARDSPRRSSSPAPAGQASPRTTGRGPLHGTARDAGPVRGPRSCAAVSGRSRPPVSCRRSGGARVGGGTSGGRSSATLPLLLFSVLRRPAGFRRPVVGPGAAERRKAADPGVRVPRPRGGPVERLALRSPRGGDPEGGAVVVGGVRGRDAGLLHSRNQLRERRTDAHCGAGRGDHVEDAVVPAHGEATQAERAGGGGGPRGAGHLPPPLGADRGRAAGIETGFSSCGKGHYDRRRPGVNRINWRVLRTSSWESRNRPPSRSGVSL